MSFMSPNAAAWRSMRSDRSVVDKRVSRETVRRVFGFARPHRRLIAIFLSLTVVDSAMVIVTPLLVQRIVDDGIIAGDGGLVTRLALAMAGAALLSAVLAVFAGWFAVAADRDPAEGYTPEDYAEHIRTEHSTYRWLLEPMLARAGFEIVDVAFEGRLFGTYTCLRR